MFNCERSRKQLIKKVVSETMLVLLIIGMLTLAFRIESVSAVDYPSVYVDPPEIIDETLTIGTNYTVSIYTDYNGSDITGYQFELSYNPNILNGVSVDNGDIIDFGLHFFMPGTFDNTAGTLSLTGAFFFLAGDVAPGPGTLANVTFAVEGIGATNITLGDNTQLIGWNFTAGKEYFIVDAVTMPNHIQQGFFNNVQPIHDVAVVQLKAPATTFSGQVPIQVIVANEGNYTESVTVRVSYNTSEIGTESFTLTSGLFKTIFLSWNTTDLTDGIYSIAAEAIMDGDEDPIDNSVTTKVIVSGTLLSVPYHHQITSYYCGPASLEMVFDYYGPDISQLEIADAARTIHEGTYGSGMKRAAHFSKLSTSKGDEMPGNVTGYTARKLGYAAFYPDWPFTLDDLKTVIDAGYPIIVGTLFSEEDHTGHYRVVVGYNATHVILHDPWSSMGPMLNWTNYKFLELWCYYGLFVSPWEVSVSAPQNVLKGDTFTVTANVTYTCPTSFYGFEYPASMTNATIMLPEGMSLDLGETARKLLGTGNLPAGDSVAVSWKVKADISGDYEIGIEAAGKVSGWFEGDSYEDRIGGLGNVNVTVNPPPTTIASVSICPIRLNLRSKGKWITCHIELPEGYDVSDIDISTVMLNDEIQAELHPTEIGDYDSDGIPDLMVKFNRAALTSHIYHTLGIRHENVTLTITGQLTDGTPFEGSDTVEVMFGGDADLSGYVETVDFFIWRENFGKTPDQCPPSVYPDFDDNGLVDTSDFFIWRENFGATVPSPP
jgi:hypothetical protein